MSLLIINNISETDEKVNEAINKLTEKVDKFYVVQATKLNVSNCIGCKTCMFVTPGKCCLKDDYTQIEELLFQYDNIIILSKTSLGFLDYRTMRILERRFSLAVIFCEVREGKIRHILRYNNKLRIGILYKGNLDQNLLNEWLDLYSSHGDDISIGSFNVKDVEEICKCIS